MADIIFDININTGIDITTYTMLLYHVYTLHIVILLNYSLEQVLLFIFISFN